MYEPLKQSGTLQEGPDTYLITVYFDVEMWGELQVPIAGSSTTRTWTVDAIITPTSISDPPNVPFDAEVGLGCTDPACTTTPDNGTPANGVLGRITANTPMTASFGVDDTKNSATLNLNNVFQIVFLPDPTSGVPCISSNCQPLNALWFGPQKSNPIRCDSQGRNGYNYSTRGCVVSVYKPIWEVSNTAFPDMGLTVKHMAKATGRLPGYAGLAGLPGVNYPLTYIGATSAQAVRNNNAACPSTQSPPPDQVLLGNTTCDEYPLASTAEGAASTGPWSICWVPPSDNTHQGQRNSQFLYDNRILINDQYYVHATYQGTNPGCSANLGGGGTIAPDNTLDSMFGSYGDNATCADWSGGDATNSVDLGGGYRAWFFSDTYMNSQAARKSLWYASSLHNSIVIQGPSGLRTITGGNTCQETNLNISFWDRYAKTPAAAPDAGGFFWTGDQMLVGSNVVKFYYHGHAITLPNGGGSFVLDYPAFASLPVSSLENNTAMTINPTEFGCGGDGIIWGTSLLNWNGYVYVYGVEQTGLYDNLYLAKTTAGGLTNPGSWQLLTGLNGTNPVWGSCSGSASPLAITDAAGASVTSINGSLWDIQFDYTNGQLATTGAIGAHPASTPWGFTNNTVPLYDPPTDSNTNPYFYQEYEARIQPGLGATGQAVISYNVNTSAVDTGCVSANAHDATIYRPRFIDVPNSDFNPALAKPAPGTSAARNATARARTGTPNAAGTGFAYGIHNSTLPPFAVAHLPVPPPAPASVKPAPARSTSVKPAAASTSATASATANGIIDGSTDWFDKPLGGSCPPLSGPTHAPSLTAASGLVTTTWDNMGTDVWYYPWICDQTTNNCTAEGASSPWVPAWPYQNSYLWTTGTAADLDPIDAVLIGTGQNSNGHKFAIYIHAFGAGNSGAGGNSPEASVTVSR